MRLLFAVSALTAYCSLTFGQTVSSVFVAEPVQKTDPLYSDEARNAGLEGDVVLTATITEDGLARDTHVSKSLGFGLDEKALEALQQWQFMAHSDQAQPVTVLVDFRLPDIQSRWHLIRAEFQTPPGVARPRFLKTNYPLGAGISLRAFEEAIVIRAIGREATATVAFDVDEHGYPANFQVLNASHPIWGPEALAVVRDWQFAPGMKNGAPTSVPGTVDLVWGPINLNRQSLEWAQAQLRGAPFTEPPPAPPIVYMPQSISYSEEARQAGLQGTVLISLLIGEDGTPGDLRVVKSLGMGLDEKAIEFVSQWRFGPTMLNGRPVAVRATAMVGFALVGGQPHFTTGTAGPLTAQ